MVFADLSTLARMSVCRGPVRPHRSIRRRSIIAAVQMIDSLEARRLLADVPLVSGRSVNATVGAPGEADTYTIHVGTSQRYLIAAVGKMSGAAGFGVQAQVIPPAGSGESTTTLTGAAGRATNGATGTWTIRVTDSGGESTGGYRLTVFVPGATQEDDDSNDFSDTTDSASANSGQRNAGTADIGDLDVWRLDVKDGQAITATVVENSAGDPVDPDVWLIDASGRLVTHRTSSVGLRLSATATKTGSYYAVVADQGAATPGVYGITFTRVPGAQYTGDPDTGPLAPNTVRMGNLPPGDGDVFGIWLAPGQTIAATLTADAGQPLDPRIELHDPSGKRLTFNSGSGQPDGTAKLTATASLGGLHYLSAFDEESDSGGTFTLQYTLVGSGGNNGIAPAGNRVRIDTDDGGDSITGRRRSVDGVDTLELTINGKTRRWYAPDVGQLALYTEGGADKVDLSGSNIPTYVSAGSGDDTLIGSGGNDSLTGGAGRNRLFGGGGDDRLNGSNGRDILLGDAGNDRLYGQAGNDLLDGGGNADRLFGGDGDDELLGGNGIDKLYGGADDDLLIGGKDDDALRGETGDDRFRALDDNRDEIYGGPGSDTILDWDEPSDVIGLGDVETIP